MIALYLLAAHMVGDFLLQTRWQAAGKLADPGCRLRHVLAYTLPFIPIAVVYGATWAQGISALCVLFYLHFVTDSQRFLSGPGEWIVCAVRRFRYGLLIDPLEPNPWPPMPILIDQALHVCQLALVGYMLTA